MATHRRSVRVRTDRTSIVVQTPASFLGTWRWTDAVDTRDYSKIAVFVDPTSVLAQTIGAEVVIAWSDDGTTVPFADGNNLQQTDSNLPGSIDGSFNPTPYTTVLLVADGSLATGVGVHLVYAVMGSRCRLGVRTLGLSGFGTYGVRVQRLVE